MAPQYLSLVAGVLRELKPPFRLDDVVRGVKGRFRRARTRTIRAILESWCRNLPGKGATENTVQIPLVYLGDDTYDVFSDNRYPQFSGIEPAPRRITLGGPKEREKDREALKRRLETNRARASSENDSRLAESALEYAAGILQLKQIVRQVKDENNVWDAVGTLPTGQHVLFELKQTLDDQNVLDAARGLREERANLAKFMDVPEARVVGTIVATHASDSAAELLRQGGIALITTSPEPRLQDRGLLPEIKGRGDFPPQRLREGHWFVVGVLGSGKTDWIKTAMANATEIGMPVFVIGDKSEYQFEDAPPELWDLRIVTLASGGRVRLDEFRDSLTTLQVDLATRTFGSEELDAALLGRGVSSTIEHLGQYPEQTRKALEDFRSDTLRKTRILESMLTTHGPIRGIDLASVEAERVELFLEAMWAVVSRTTHQTGPALLLVVDPLEGIVKAPSSDGRVLRAIEQLMTASRSGGVRVIVGTQSARGAYRQILSQAHGVLIFRSGGLETLREIARNRGIDLPKLTSLAGDLPPPVFVAIAGNRVEGVYT